MSDSKSVMELCSEYPNLNEYIHQLEQRIKDYEQYTASIYCPNKKTYKELEAKLALAENSKQTEIDELYETKIGPLQNKVKDQHIQLESQYKRETKLQQQIKELETLVKDQQTIINYAAGYISACEQFRDKHLNDVKNWLFEGLK